MKAVMISIQPYWVFLIIAKAMGWEIKQHKEIEVRKNYPKAEDWNKVVKIYCSKDIKSFNKIHEDYRPAIKKFLGKVIGEFVCDNIYLIKNRGSNFVVANEEQRVTNVIARQSYLDYDDMVSYLGNKDGYAWHISNLVIYDEPKELSEFHRECDYEKDCGDCPYLCVTNTPTCYETWCEVDEHMPLTRPPQSWCYVEEKEKENETN